jgi:tyrosyl-tRNA synthetase
MTLSEELKWRGFTNQTTFTDPQALDDLPLTFYWGVDPSSDSMQVGNFAIAMMIRHFIDHGHHAVLLVGGATGMIGDPDGKDEERSLKPLEEVARNKAGIAAQYKRVFEGQPFTIVDNYDWFRDIGYLQFLRETGKHFSMTQLLDRDFVQSRIGDGGAGLSYAEFSYSLMQGYDFLHLHREMGVTLQVCGADQWGNSLSGVQLIRKLDSHEAHIWSAPLVINKSTGKKFGKSEDGAVWLDEKRTSVYQFYQFWLNTDDEGVIDYAKIYTLLPREKIDRLTAATKANPGAREAQKTLAFEVTKLVHGKERAESVRRVTDVLFGGHNVDSLTSDDLEVLAAEIPVAPAGSVLDALVATGLLKSTSEGKRLLASGAISVNGEKVSEDVAVSAASLIKKGKNSFVLVR